MRKFLLLVVVLLSSCAAAAPRADEGAQEAKGSAPTPTPASRVDAARLLGDVRALAADEMEGRATGTPGAARARAYVAGRFAEAGLKPLGPTFEQTFNLSGRAGQGVNLVGHVVGGRRPARLIVITAHYDHLGVRGGQVYNGADDNASGVAALIQLAAHFVREPPAHTIVFAALDAEETGFEGARALVASLKREGREVALNVNLDMIGHSERGELYAAGAHHTPALRPVLERVAAGARVKLLLGHDRPELGSGDWTKQSDHFAFHREKIPFVYFGVEDHKDYHRPTDDFETLTTVFYVRAVETILEAVAALDAGLN